jgi:hypothetical protein
MNVEKRGKSSAEPWKPVAKSQNERLIALLVAGVLALSFPLLSLFIKFSLVCGIPLLYFYLFFVWALIIVSAFLIMKGRRSSPDSSSSGRGGDTE